MKYLISLAFLFSAQLSASQSILECVFFLNGSVHSKAPIDLPIKSKTKWASFEDLEFFISGPNKINHHIIEIFNPNTPSREYVEGELQDQGDSLAYASWTRSSLLELKCSRLNKL